MAVTTKTPVKKAATVKAAGVKTPVATNPVVAKKTPGNVKTDVFDLTGKVIATIALPGELFDAKVNKALMTQAVRVYLANQRKGTQSTKTRGEVEGSTRKIYRQKGTGRARHGGVRAPIFVGGGVALGPKPRDHSLSLPQKMRKAALSSALTGKLSDGQVKVVDGLETLDPKTKLFVEILKKLALDTNKKKILLVLPEKTDKLQKAVRNVEGVTFVLANQLNTYEVLNTRTLLLMKSAVITLEKTFGGEK